MRTYFKIYKVRITIKNYEDRSSQINTNKRCKLKDKKKETVFSNF